MRFFWTKIIMIFGETTPVYMYWKESPKRIYEYNPEMKIIIILRNPIDRAYSNWNMERSRNNDNLSFDDAVDAEKDRCRETLPYQHRYFSYIDRGHYLEQLQRIWSYFPKERVLILKSEDLKKNPIGPLNQASDFLGVSKFKNVKKKKVHSRPYTSQMSKEKRIFFSLYLSQK
ncbi:MAG: sulfotransferase domain-containing protein, partial [Pseudomonadales bacterium]